MDPIQLIDEINKVKPGKSYYMKDVDAYATFVGGYKGVAILLDKPIVIRETFNKVILQNARITLEEKDYPALVLVTEESMFNLEYGFLCLDFVDLKKREEIKKNPYSSFYDKWKTLIGNAVLGKTTYDVLGEMKTIEVLQKQGKKPLWNAMNKSTFDISCDGEFYETKTTKYREESLVTIHSQYQADIEKLGSKLFLSFVRVEENDAGVSIEDLFNSITSKGLDKMEVDNYLSSIGLYKGKNERNKKYLIHEMRFYPVDENFPKIVKSTFKNDCIPAGVVKYEYTVDLQNLKNEQII